MVMTCVACRPPPPVPAAFNFLCGCIFSQGERFAFEPAQLAGALAALQLGGDCEAVILAARDALVQPLPSAHLAPPLWPRHILRGQKPCLHSLLR